MKTPELTDVSAAGVQDWDSASDTLRTAAKAARMKFYSVDLSRIVGKPALLKALEKGINLPEHFGHNCPSCRAYWRSGPWPNVCPYCRARASGYQFLSEAQRTYVRHYCEVSR